MKSYFLFSVLLTLLLVTSCNQLSKEEKEFDALTQKVIDVHDEVMPKMGEISSLIKDLEPKIDTTANGKSYLKAQQDLKDSYDHMMEWMRDYSEKFPHTEEKMTVEKITTQMKLLKEEEVEINNLRDEINSSILNAKKILKKS